MSFKTKVDLLTGIGALSKKTVGKFVKAMEIRNQFMHNSDADSFENCLSHLPGALEFLTANYPLPKDIKEEEKLHFLFFALLDDVLSIAYDVYSKVREKEEKRVVEFINKRITDTLPVIIEQSKPLIYTAIKDALKLADPLAEMDFELAIDKYVIILYEKILEVLRGK